MRVCLGDVTLDTDEHVLLVRGRECPLSPKAFQLLTLLVESRPRVVSKEAISEALWPSTFVSEGNLSVLVAEVRKALGESGRGRGLVRTVHGLGYAVTAEASGGAREAELLVWLEDRALPLREGENVLGRGTECSVRVDRDTVSRRHARILVADGEAVLEDLESKNGTFLGGRRVTGRAPLACGDVIGLGKVVLKFGARDGARSTRTEL